MSDPPQLDTFVAVNRNAIFRELMFEKMVSLRVDFVAKWITRQMAWNVLERITSRTTCQISTNNFLSAATSTTTLPQICLNPSSPSIPSPTTLRRVSTQSITYITSSTCHLPPQSLPRRMYLQLSPETTLDCPPHAGKHS